jgi:hypothetical protein
MSEVETPPTGDLEVLLGPLPLAVGDQRADLTCDNLAFSLGRPWPALAPQPRGAERDELPPIRRAPFRRPTPTSERSNAMTATIDITADGTRDQDVPQPEASDDYGLPAGASPDC